MRSFLPHLFTLANAFSGSLAIIHLFREEVTMVWLWFGLALVFDLLDGATARMLKQSSALGRELDSLADAISFSLLPGLVLYQWLYEPPFDPFQAQTLSTEIIASAGLIFTMAGLFRLATFNLDTARNDYFSGLPTPAAAIAVLSLSVVLHSGEAPEWLYNQYALYGLIFLLSWLMVSSYKVIHLKFSNGSWGQNWHRYIFLGGLVLGGLLSWRWTLVCIVPWLLVWSFAAYSIVEVERS